MTSLLIHPSKVPRRDSIAVEVHPRHMQVDLPVVVDLPDGVDHLRAASRNLVAYLRDSLGHRLFSQLRILLRRKNQPHSPRSADLNIPLELATCLSRPVFSPAFLHFEDLVGHGEAMTLKEIAEAEGISEGHVNVTIQRALRKLRNQGLMLPMRELAEELDRGRKGIVQWEQ